MYEKIIQNSSLFFDYFLDVSAIGALKSIYKIDENLPALIINGKTYKGFKTKKI
ncbi:MAG: hypothetical protein R3B65_02425 [Candidatus Paceibacterota bacterium]